MKVLKSWLKDYVDINIDNRQLAEKLSLSGTLVETVGAILDDGVVVAEIKDIRPHPNADRLQIAIVYDGREDLQIVCGAPNIEVGQKVPLAQINTILPEGKIKKAEIRGVESFGMLCSERELGLGEGKEGIKILPSDYEPGKSLNDYLDGDAVFELEITPNRGDCLSHRGVAREVAATLDENLKSFTTNELAEVGETIDVDIVEAQLCRQYYALPIHGLKVQESPEWLKNRLKAIGQKPINNIVDVTNYIMFDLGQPLHAFDYGKIEKGIIVRNAKPAEKITTLDKTERSLNEEMLVIADVSKPIAIAGVMGGANSEVDLNTTDIVLESAEFEPASVRKTAKTLNLSTEASYRYERGIDSGGVKDALQKAASMIIEIAGGKVGRPAFAGKPPEQSKIGVNSEKINDLLGLKLSDNEINNKLEKLGFVAQGREVLIPLWRHDISISEDLAEEVGRIYGFNEIEDILPEKTQEVAKSQYFVKERLKDILVEAGFNETYTYAFLSEEDIKLARLETNDLLEILNPLQKENKFLRNSLIPGLLKAIAKNPSFDQTFLFEIGNVFNKSEEKTVLGIVSAGKLAKQAINNAIEKVSAWAEVSPDEIKIQEIPGAELQRYKIKKPLTYMAEVEVFRVIKTEKIYESKLSIPKISTDYRQVSRYPAVTRDLAFIVGTSTDAFEVEKAILGASESVLLTEVFDEFTPS